MIIINKTYLYSRILHNPKNIHARPMLNKAKNGYYEKSAVYIYNRLNPEHNLLPLASKIFK
jgi:hypothetical protein